MGTASCETEDTRWKARETHLHPLLVWLPVTVLRVSSVMFCTYYCFPEALKACPKSHWVFTALNEVTKSKDTTERTLVKERVKKEDECSQSWTTRAAFSCSLHSSGLGILLREFITSYHSHGLRDVHRASRVNSLCFEEVPCLKQFFRVVCKHGFAIVTDVRWEMWKDSGGCLCWWFCSVLFPWRAFHMGRKH